MAPIPHSSRASDFKTGTHDGARVNAEFDQLYASAVSLLTQIENALGLHAVVSSEILAARNGRANLDALMDELLETKAELETARNSANQGGAFASLDARLEAIDTRITNAIGAIQADAEVVEARTDAANKVHAAIRDAINKGSKDLEGLSLAAINRVVLSSSTIIDAFVYDPSRDSDGGAWRERCQHLTWFNEPLNTAFRGKTAKFPAIALLIVDGNTLKIYDAADPSLPLWMQFNQSSSNAWRGNGAPLTLSSTNLIGQVGSVINAVAALNARIVLALSNNPSSENVHDSAAIVIDFLGDKATCYSTVSYGGGYWLNGIANRNIGMKVTAYKPPFVVHVNAYHVAAAVLPGAPLENGLPVPTFGVATFGGGSRINHDGTVTNYSGTADYNKLLKVAYHPGFGDFIALRAYNGGGTFGEWVSNFGNLGGTLYALTGTPSILGGFNTIRDVKALPPAFTAIGATRGLSIVADNPADKAKGMVAYITKDYATGLMPGDIRRAWLASGTAETITGVDIQNGTFSDFSGWTNYTTAPSSVTASGGAMVFSRDGAQPYAGTPYNITAGRSYIVSFNVVSFSNPGMNIGLSVGAGSVTFLTGSGFTSTGKYSFIWTPSTSGTELRVHMGGDGPNSISIDNLSIRLADEDRSAKNKGISIYGSLTKSAVAPGAELMGYSGFSASNYLEEPYSSDLDFGTGDFCILGWFNLPTHSLNGRIVNRRDAGTGLDAFVSYVTATEGYMRFVGSNSDVADTITGNRNVIDGVWHLGVYRRKDGVVDLLLDTNKNGTGACSRNLSGNFPTRIGVDHNYTQQFGGKLALWRIAAFAPSDEQIRMIFEYERRLFEENAKCLLGGTSNEVRALDYDPETGILLVATANGVSMFQGLRRTNYISGSPLTSNSMKAVSGRNGAILMAGAAEAVYQAPQRNIREEVERVKRRFVSQVPRTAWLTADGSKTEFDLPTRAARILTVSQNGAIAREVSGAGASKYTVKDYGYKQAILFGTAPAAGDVGISYVEEL